ncbi:ATP-binding protein [Actinoplanes sp. GCM10030250]|uniref:ATP-binding protein n=1 Tax=Actinoplanes sp. GCM10030250 TaxID=3273376 RepID=UPI0036169693
MSDPDEALDGFEALLERSSLGAPGARELRRRTSGAHLMAAQRIGGLRERLARAQGDEAAAAADALVAYLRQLGFREQADEVQRTRTVERKVARPSARPAPGASGDLRERVSVALDVESSVLALSVHGAWDRELHRDTTTAVRKGLSQVPRTLILDLTDLADRHAASVPTWVTAAVKGRSMDPAVQVMACVPADTALRIRLDRTGASRHLRAFPSLDQARAAAAESSPSQDRLQLDLTPDFKAPPLARALVAEACAAWGTPALLDRGRLVISELVVNAVEHAGSRVRVRVHHRGGGLHIAVQDGNSTMPRLSAAVSGSLSMSPARLQQGLRIVHATASAWGALPTGDGKIVWAMIR